MTALASLDFNATTSTIDCGTGSSIANIFNGGGTAMFWMRAQGIGEGGEGRILWKRTGSAGWEIHLRTVSTARIQFVADMTSLDGVWYTNTSVSISGAWTSVWLQWNDDSPSTAPSVWINSSSSSMTTTLSPIGSWSSDSSINFRIGNQTSGSSTFDGQICYVQLWNRVLSVAEMNEANYKPGSITTTLQGFWPLVGPNASALDLSGNGNTGTLSNTAASLEGPPVRCSI